ncbi:MAG: hypothetical protein Kapaf2KO_15550 [Candidatus Kapaibacteriales bacterium]
MERNTIFSYGIVASIGIIVVYFGLGGGFLLALGYVVSDLSSTLTLLTQGLAQLAFLLVPTYILFRRSSLKDNDLYKAVKSWKIILLSISGWIGLFFFIQLTDYLTVISLPESLYNMIKELSEPYQSVIFDLTGENTPLLLQFIVIALIPSITEEYFFRGFLQRHIAIKLKGFKLYLIVAIVFSVVHFNPISILGLVLLSIYMSAITEATGSLYASTLVHLINNSTSLFLLNIYGNKVMVSGSYSEMNLLDSLGIVMFGLLGLALCWYSFKSIKSNLKP